MYPVHLATSCKFDPSYANGLYIGPELALEPSMKSRILQEIGLDCLNLFLDSPL